MSCLILHSFYPIINFMRLHAFTLIELLVTITVIALLVAILIPTIAMVRVAAYTTTCASNHRQIVMGAMQLGHGS